MKRFLIPSSIRGKILLGTLSVSLLLALWVGIEGLFLAQGYLRENREQSALLSLSLLAGEIRSDYSDVLAFAGYLSLDSQTARYLTEAGKAGAAGKDGQKALRSLSLSVWNHLQSQHALSPASRVIPRFLVSTLDGTSYLQISQNPGSSGADLIDRLKQAPFFEELLAAPNYAFPGFYENPLGTAYHPLILPILRPIRGSLPETVLGFFYLEITPSLFSRHMEAFRQGDERLYLSFGERTYLYADKGTFLPVSLPEEAISLPLPDMGVTLHLLPSMAEERAKRRDVFLLLLPALFVILGGGVMLSLFLRRDIAVPIGKLTAALHQVGQGDFTRHTEIEWDNELGEIGRGINRLSADIEDLMEKRLQDEARSQKLKYDMLLQQVNPHFLYNTLGAIKWMAAIQGSEGIAEVVTALTKLLQSISKGGADIIPLERELDLLRDYFTIMRYRYGGVVELEVKVDDPALLTCGICRFSLQPIVENAIFHGIVPRGQGTIQIHIYAEDSPWGKQSLRIDVTDDGIGMEEDLAREVLAGKELPGDGFFRHVGIANVAERIAYAFGPEYGLAIHSVPGRGTTMAFTLPGKAQQEEAKAEKEKQTELEQRKAGTEEEGEKGGNDPC